MLESAIRAVACGGTGRRVALVALLCGAWAATAGAAVRPGPGGAAGGTKGDKDEVGLRVDFPDVKGFERSERRPLPAESGGYSVGYNSEERVAVTVYVYNRGRKTIPNDLADAGVKAEMDGAKAVLGEMERRGTYKGVREVASGTATLGAGEGAPKALYARFEMTMRDTAVVSELYVLAYKDHYVKVRATRPADAPAQAGESLKALYAALGKALGRK